MRLIFLFLSGFSFLFGKPLEVEIHARSAILMNAETGAILFERHAHIPTHPASTTKIATTLYVLDQKIDLGQSAKVSKESLKEKPATGKPAPWWLESDGMMMGLKVGEIIPIDALLHGLILMSANDAANVIAENIEGSVPQFMEKVNLYLGSIGCKNTQFNNPHGLTDSEHLSTAYDLAVMARRGLNIPKFRELVATRLYMKPQTNKQGPEPIKLFNPLMKPTSHHFYPKAIGIKTGYTQAAKYNLVAAAENEGRTLIAVLLGCENSADRFQDAKKLFEAAFSENKTSRRLMGSEHVFTKDLAGSKKGLKASLKTALSISYFPSEERKCKAALHWDSIALPIRKGQKVGEVHILDEDNRFLEKGDLIAIEEIKGSLLFLLKQKLSKLFG